MKIAYFILQLPEGDDSSSSKALCSGPTYALEEGAVLNKAPERGNDPLRQGREGLRRVPLREGSSYPPLGDRRELLTGN